MCTVGKHGHSLVTLADTVRHAGIPPSAHVHACGWWSANPYPPEGKDKKFKKRKNIVCNQNECIK